MKKILIFLLVPFSSFSQLFNLYDIPASQIDINEILLYEHKFDLQNVPAFQASDQITVEQYGYYLKCIQYDSTENFFKSQIPNLNNLKVESLEEYFLDIERRNEPVMGVSMRQAINFCIWVNDIFHIKSKEDFFRLPTAFEWVAIDQFSEKLPFNPNHYLSDWTLSSYDESSYAYLAADYVYISLPDDPPSMKRKRIMGNNYKYSLSDYSDQYNRYCYEDSSYAYVGFRLVKVNGEISDQKDIIKRIFVNEVTIDTTSYIDTTLSIGENKFQYSLVNGLLNGDFIQKNKDDYTISGYFRNNQRHGLWTVKDNSEQLLLARLYINNKRYIALYPNHSPNKSSYIIEHQYFDKKFDQDSIILFDYVLEADVIYSKRIWKIIKDIDNPFLESSRIFDHLIKSVQNNELDAYHASNDHFKTELNANQVDSIASNDYVIEGFEIKEDFFLDRNRILGDTRIIGFAPYFIEQESNERKKICWFYYPACRKYLSEIKVSGSELNHINNVNDLFYWGIFKSEIIKVTSIYGTNYSEPPKNIQLDLLNLEHDMWIQFNR